MPSETGRPVPYLDEVALTFPQLRIVAGHIGHPWTDEMIGLEARERLHRHLCPRAALLSPATCALHANVWARQSALWNQLSATVLGEVRPTGRCDALAWEGSDKVFGWKRVPRLSTRLNQVKERWV